MQNTGSESSLKPTEKPFAEVDDRTVYVAVYANPPRIYWCDGPREDIEEIETLDEAMKQFAEGIIDRLANEAGETSVYEQYVDPKAYTLVVKVRGEGKQEIHAASIEAAAKAFEKFRDKGGYGASDLQHNRCGADVRDRAGKLVAEISYNGRISEPCHA